MHNTRKAKSYVPSVYEGFVEMEKIVDTGDKVIDEAEKQVASLLNNQWITHADEKGVEEWESILNIIASPGTEDLAFRRSRIINRLANRMPFTETTLRQKLDGIIGSGNYILTIDNNKYIIYLESSATNQSWHTETIMTINNMKPCNMVFINTPFVNAGLDMEETIDYTEIIYNYTLGSGFQLGMRPFTTYIDEVVVKLANSSSITNKFLNSVATFAANDIAAVKINDSVIINTFDVKAADGNSVTVSYNVNSGQVSEITNVKLLDSSNNVLSSADVYVPMTSAVIMKHTILVKEG